MVLGSLDAEMFGLLCDSVLTLHPSPIDKAQICTKIGTSGSKHESFSTRLFNVLNPFLSGDIIFKKRFYF